MFGFGKKNIKVLDSSVLVDGRILGIIETGFLEGTLKVPSFIVVELQSLADSQSMEKRKKGQKALALIEQLKKIGAIEIEDSLSDSISKIKEVDTKLVFLCKELGAKLITLDYNLNKVAKIHDVSVLNINDLFAVLRPPFVMGDKITVKIVKPGEKPGQGVGSLEDGTMVVVDDAIEMIGKSVNGTVRHLSQIASGRIIFAKITE